MLCNGLGLVVEDLAHRVGGAPGRRVVVMGVPLEGESDGGVPGEGLKIADGLATLGEEREVRVPEVVEPDRREHRFFEEWIEATVDYILSVERSTLARGENEL